MIMKDETRKCNGKMRVTFALPASLWADTIHLVGDFNNWSPTATPLRLDDHHWSVTLDLDQDTIYQYRYLVNRKEWMIDWNTDGHAVSDNGLSNSVVVTRLPTMYAPQDGANQTGISPLWPEAKIVSNEPAIEADLASVYSTG